jgi:ribonuclease P protein component
MTLLQQTFKKEERLCLKKQVGQLFESGKALMAYPTRVQYLLVDAVDDAPAKILFSVPKKRFKRAVKRNLIRRRMREAYRLHKHLLYPHIPEGRQLIFALIYLDKEILPYASVQKGVLKAIGKLIETVAAIPEDTPKSRETHE